MAGFIEGVSRDQATLFQSGWTTGLGKITLCVWLICSLTSSIYPRSDSNAMPLHVPGDRVIIRPFCSSCSSTAT